MRQNLDVRKHQYSLVTNHELTRGLFKRLDGIIALAEETPIYGHRTTQIKLKD